jgi:uncharacterized delta-60 repeat protein
MRPGSLWLCFFACCFGWPIHAQLFVGSDTTWAEQGAYVSSLSGYQAGGVDVFVRPDGNLVFVGNSSYVDVPYDFAPFSTLLDPDGRPIRNYGHFGSRLHEEFMGMGTYYNLSAAMLSDGTLWLGGSSTQYGSWFKHFDMEGDVDTTFGTNGDLFMDSLLTLGAIVALPNDQVIVAGGVGPNGSVSRFGPTGIPDPTFGVQGRILLPGSQVIRKVKVLPDGRLFCGAGTATQLESLIMLTPDGLLDTSFTGDGLARGGFPFSVRLRGLCAATRRAVHPFQR